MTDRPIPAAPAESPRPPATTEAREFRLAAALRANLRRRKAGAKATAGEED
ncbi:MAG: hypothetical protein ACR2FH_02670 [Caulobacteraceae bacterium]